MKILVVEDEPKVRDFVKKALDDAGMVVDAVSTLSDLLTVLKTNSYDSVVLDRLLHGKDSLDYLPQIRAAAPQTKILVLSALSEVDEKVKGLNEGADDYLAKPFHVSELLARLRSLTRRAAAGTRAEKDTDLSYKDLKIDLATQRVLRGTNKIDLSAKEYRLLCTLARTPCKIFSKMELLDQVWEMNHFPESNVVEVTIAGLRAKVDKGYTPLIQSKRGAGYWLGEP